ncbi:unnamed protein product [Callosobruchus maculatus]|uniref:Uncharacterized protein n=1 Tax=Callosobruchus maculatus TaxID=64391 RepID=A0A653DTJ7_CALMS|nr:unnamed protein product [Callosobruchus maculatus]
MIVWSLLDLFGGLPLFASSIACLSSFKLTTPTSLPVEQKAKITYGSNVGKVDSQHGEQGVHF